jgi:hypothetical protein
VPLPGPVRDRWLAHSAGRVAMAATGPTGSPARLALLGLRPHAGRLMDPEPSPVIRRDRMPARVTLPDGTDLAEARAVLTQERLYVWVASGETVELRAELPYARERSVVPPGDTAVWTVQTDEGVALVDRGRGCGCGSTLRQMVPFSPMRAGN